MVDGIVIKLAGNQFRYSLNSSHFLSLSAGKKYCGHDSTYIFHRIVIKLAGKKDRHELSDEFDVWPDRTFGFRVTCP